MLLRSLQPLIGFILELRSVQPLAKKLAGTRQVNSTIDSATRPTIDRTMPRRDTGHNEASIQPVPSKPTQRASLAHS